MYSRNRNNGMYVMLQITMPCEAMSIVRFFTISFWNKRWLYAEIFNKTGVIVKHSFWLIDYESKIEPSWFSWKLFWRVFLY